MAPGKSCKNTEGQKMDGGKKQKKDEKGKKCKEANSPQEARKAADAKRGGKSEIKHPEKNVKSGKPRFFTMGKGGKEKTKESADTKAEKEQKVNTKTHQKLVSSKETSKKPVADEGKNKIVKSKAISRDTQIKAVKLTKADTKSPSKKGSKVVESDKEESESEEESTEEESEETGSSKEGKSDADSKEESTGSEDELSHEEEACDTEHEVEKEEEHKPSNVFTSKGEPEEEPITSENETNSEAERSDTLEDHQGPSTSVTSIKQTGPLQLSTQLLGQGARIKSKMLMKKGPIAEEKPKKDSIATKPFPMKGLVFNKNAITKGKPQILQIAKTAKTKDKKQSLNEDIEASPCTSSPKTLMAGKSYLMLNLKVKKKENKTSLNPRDEPNNEKQNEDIVKERQSNGQPKNLGLALAKVKMASMRYQTRKNQRMLDELALVDEAVEATYSKVPKSLVAQRKSINTLRRVSGWIQKKIPKSNSLRIRLTTVSRAIGITRWLSAQAAKHHRSSKQNVFHRKVIKGISSTATLARKKAQLPIKGAKDFEEEMASYREKQRVMREETQDASSDDLSSSPQANDSHSEPEEKANSIDPKYAIVFPRMHKIGKGKGGSPSSTSARTASTVKEPKRVPPKPGARLVLPVQPDLTLLKSVKKISHKEGQPKNSTIDKNVEEKGLEKLDTARSLIVGKGHSTIQSARGKLRLKPGASELTLSKNLSGTELKLKEGISKNKNKKESVDKATEAQEERTVITPSFYEEEADREVAELMGEDTFSTSVEVHWAQDHPFRSDPQGWLKAETLLPHQTVEKLSKWSVYQETEQCHTIPVQNGKGPWEAEDVVQNMLESRLTNTQVNEIKVLLEINGKIIIALYAFGKLIHNITELPSQNNF